IGANVFNMGTSTFALHRGPIFTDLLLVDEINRTPPRTQSALLEAMEERQVTFEGTYPLPEAQLDRFLAKIRIGYTSGEQEVQILENVQNGFDSRELKKVAFETVAPEALMGARVEAAQVKVEPALFQYIVKLVGRTRNWPSVSLGG